MASRTNKSKRNQGPRLAPAGKGKTSGNPMKPALAARIKNSQSMGGGVRQGKGGAKYVTSAAQRGSRVGVNQSQNLAAKRITGAKGKMNLKPVKAQPRYPKAKSNNLVLQNKIGSTDVARLQRAAQAPMPKLTGGAFKSYIGGK